MTNIANTARARLAKGELAIGAGVRITRSVEIAQMMKTAGFDWLFIDLEHGAMAIGDAVQISVAALSAGIAPIVRVPNGQYDMATRALDGGAQGIVIPHVDTPEEAREVVDRLKYPPEGHRSVAGGMAQVSYGSLSVADTANHINKEQLNIVMIETPKAVENAEAIAAVPGIDVLLIGTNDLAMELGIPGDFKNDKIVGAYERVIAGCKKHGKWPGMGGVYSEDLLARYIGMGMRCILSGADFSFLMGAASARAKAVRASLK